MQKKSKIILLSILIIIIGITFFKLYNIYASDDNSHPFFVAEEFSNQDDTIIYDIYADFTYHPDYKFNHINFKVYLTNLSFVSLKLADGFQWIKNDPENLQFEIASNKVYTKNDGEKIKFATITLNKIDHALGCTFNFESLDRDFNIPVNNFNIQKRAMVGDQEIHEIYEGDEFKYVLDITGENKIESDELVVTDTIPSELIIVNNGGATRQNGQTLTWNLGKQKAGNFKKTIEVTVKAKTTIEANQIKNIAILTVGDKEDSDEATVEVLHPQITITKNANKKEVNLGDEIYYDLTIKNIGTGTASNIKVTDNFDTKYLEYLRTDSDLNITQSYSGNKTVLSFVIPSLNQNISKTVRLYFKVKSNFEENIIPNIANATYKDQVEEDDEEVTVLKPNLTIEKTVSKEVVKRGETFTYNIKIANIGNGVAKNVIITDQINSYLEILSASEGTYQDNNYRVNYTALGPNETKMVTLTVKAKNNAPLGTINNIATVESDNTPEISDDAQVEVTDSKITITKTASKSIVKTNEEFIYTLVVKNIGDYVSDRITVTDVINTNLEIIDADGGSVNGNTISWIIDKLDVDANKTYNIRVKVKKDTPDMTIPNVAKAQEENKDEVTSNVDVEVKSPKLELKKEVITKSNNNYITPGEEYSYKITVTNKGEIASDKITITDKIDDNLTILDANGGTINNKTITWVIESLKANESISFIIKVKLSLSVVNGTKINNKAVLTHNDEKLEDEVQVDVITDDLYIIKVANKEKVQVNDEFTYTIRLGNRGNKTASNVLIKDNIPSNLEVLSYETTKGTIKVSNNYLEVNIPSLIFNEEVIITLNVKVLSGKKDDIILNTAILSCDDKTLESSDDVTIVDTDIVIKKASSVVKTFNNYEYYYTITVTNKGNIAARNLEVVDTLDDALTILDAGGGIIADKTIRWVIDILNPNESKIFTIKVMTTNSLNNDEVLNKVVVHEEGKPDKSDEVVVIVEDINFSIRKEVNKNKVFKGEEFTYTIIVKNESNVAVDNVKISDQIDENLIIVKTDAINNEGILTWTDNFAPLEEKRYTIVVTTKKDINVNQVINAALLTYQDKYVDSNEVIVTLEDLNSPQTGSYINYFFIGFAVLALIFIYLKIQKKNKIYKI